MVDKADQRQENQWAINMVRAYETALEQLRPIHPVIVCRIEDVVAALIDGHDHDTLTEDTPDIVRYPLGLVPEPCPVCGIEVGESQGLAWCDNCGWHEPFPGDR